MKVPSRRYSRGVSFNLTPLIDIVFQLIIFFLVASHFVRNENVEAVTLPEATQGESDDLATRRLVVTITADESLSVAGNRVDAAQVERMLLAEKDRQGFELHIRSDQAVPYRIVEPLLLSAARAGVTKIRFAVLPE